MIGAVARVFGVRSVLPIVRSLEAGAYGAYMAQDEAAQAIAPDERQHRKAMSRLDRPTSAEPAEAILSRERWHRSGGGGTLRASIFGASDGLVSNTALVMGFAGAQTSGDFVLLAGIAGLLAGAFSMAAGEYVSMRAQRELFERQIELERAELEGAPEEELAELSLIYQAKGLPKEEADATAARLMEDPQIALDTLVREELGLDPSELGSPWGASIGSFLAFAIGAFVPVVPFVFADASTPFVVASAALSTIALFAVGAGVSLFTGRSALYSGARQVGLGAAAAAVTFVIGRIIGVSTGL
jgi:VIT1/CCC1 family predicted Fe2+/Mn2+ transporter